MECILLIVIVFDFIKIKYYNVYGDNMILFDRKYELVKNYNEGFNEEEVLEKCTDYYKDFDYIVGDIAYGKLRLKGFNETSNPNFKDINDYKKIDKYILENCAYGCKYFILKRLQK